MRGKVMGILLLTGGLAMGGGCTTAPISAVSTGRSLGTGKVSLDAGLTYNLQIPALKLEMGVLDQLDFGLQYEQTDFGFLAKYSLFQNDLDGPSLAFVGSYGTTGKGKFAYAGAIGSWIFSEWIEPYVSLRFTHVSWEAGDPAYVTTPEGVRNYIYPTVGLAIWPVPWLGALGEVGFFTPAFPAREPVVATLSVMFKPMSIPTPQGGR